MTSVNYNASATAALRTLQATNSQLDAVQNRVSTGFKIGEAKDNAAYWSISTTLESDNRTFSTVKDALGLGAATVDVAYEGLNAAKDVLDEIKSKLTAASQNGVDRKAVQAEIDALQDQLKSIAGSSTFSGENWLSVNSSLAGYTSSKSVVASFTRDANNSVSIGTIDVAISDVAMYDAGATGSGILDKQVALTKADGTALTVGGNAASGLAPALQGLSGATATAGQDVGVLEKAKITLGTFSAAGIDTTDRLSFDLTVNGVTKTVTASLAGVGNATQLGGAIDTAISTAFGSAVATFNTTDATAGKLSIETATSGVSSSISIANLKGVDGNGTLTGVSAIVATGDFGAAGKAKTATMTLAATVGTNVDAGDTLQFTFQYNGDTYTTSTHTIAAADVATDNAYAAVLQTLVDTATKVSNGTTLGSGKVTVNHDVGGVDGAMNFETVGTGPLQNIGILSVTTTDVAGGASTTGFTGAGLAAGAVGTDTTATVASISYAQTGAADGDRISFDMTMYLPNADDSASVATKKTITFQSSATPGTYTANLQAALDAAFGAGNLAATSTTISTVNAKGSHAGIVITSATAQDGNGVVTSAMGLSTGATSDTGRDLVATATKASIDASGSFAGPVTYDEGDAVSFDIKLNGATTAVTINKSTIDAALGTTTGTIADANQFAVVMNKALADAGLDTSLVASNNGGALKIEKTTAGAATLEIGNVASTSGGQTISVDEIDITSSAFTSLAEAQQRDVLNAYISVVSAAITKVTSAAAGLGAISSRIELQQTFVNTLMDTIDKGVSGLVDADMSEESTKLQALQTKQQLGVQALSIANSSAQNILRLFQ